MLHTRPLKLEEHFFPQPQAFSLLLFPTKQTLAKLDECGAALGLLLDEGRAPRSAPGSAAVTGAVSPVGGALELRWQSACRQTEQAAQRCTDIQDSELR